MAPLSGLTPRRQSLHLAAMRSFSAAILALVLALPATLCAQAGKPAVQLKAVQETEEPRAGEKLRLALRVSLPEGFHVQSDAPRDPAFIPTVLTIEAPDGITIDNIIYPKAVDLKQGDQTLAVFEREFVIGVRATVARNAEPGDWVVKAKLRYQACNDKACYPPTTTDAVWQLYIEKAKPPAQQHGDPFGSNSPSRPANPEPHDQSEGGRSLADLANGKA
jgi:thiol:disulfide interchange protein DsbD